MAKKAQAKDPVGKVMVVGAGIAGVQAALDLANAGFYVHLVEKKSAIGGVMAQLDKTFPTNDCSMCIISPKLVEAGRHLNIDLLTYTEVEGIRGEPGKFEVDIVKRGRGVDMSKCTGCGVCLDACPIRYEVQIPGEADRAARTAYSKLTDEEMVAKIIDQYRDEPGNLLPILLDINRKFNWLPRCALEHVSDELRLPMAEILRVASFYNAFSLVPRGKNIISLCMGTGCFVKGSPRLLDRLERELGIKHGQTTEDFMFSLEMVRCIGCCALAPAMRVGDDTFGRLSPSMIPKILKSYAESYGIVEEEVEVA
ncbi:MAG: FAD-dependent oxidoreductase [Deltaproteobacteria bacterium]|nr:MAG: FAD-dependent oxidoreductase [Deltaproteobacteria bacterium]